MFKIIALIVLIVFIDFRSTSIKVDKKEIIIYIVLCLFTIGIGAYSLKPNFTSIAGFFLNMGGE